MSTIKLPVCKCSNINCTLKVHVVYCPVFGTKMIKVDHELARWYVANPESIGKCVHATATFYMRNGRECAITDTSEWT